MSIHTLLPVEYEWGGEGGGGGGDNHCYRVKLPDAQVYYSSNDTDFPSDFTLSASVESLVKEIRLIMLLCTGGGGKCRLGMGGAIDIYDGAGNAEVQSTDLKLDHARVQR